MNINFAADNLSAVWNYFDAERRCYSWLLRFANREQYDAFQHGFSKLMWETLNEEKFEKVKGVEQRYINEAYEEDVEMLEDVEEGEEAENDRVRRDDEEAEVAAELEELDGEEEEGDGEDHLGDLPASIPVEEGDNEHNSQLTVGYKFDRSFVVRGNRIGVFKHTDDDQLEFSTTINKVSTPNGKVFNPQKVRSPLLLCVCSLACDPETDACYLPPFPVDYAARSRLGHDYDGSDQQACAVQDGSRVWKSGG
jgi:hypothetical protein